jgi:hypothetical protein
MINDRIRTGIYMILRMLLRRQIAIVLIAIIPIVFLSVVEFTTSERMLPFRLASLSEDVIIETTEKGISFIFFAIASAGFLVSFLALNLIQKNNSVNRRLIICGYHPVEILISSLATLFLMIFLIAIYVATITNLLFPVNHLYLFFYSLVLIGFVYGCYGLLIGSLVKGELEGILFIVLLVNIDAGWLQNPLFYEEAQNKMIIRFLPAYFPSQTAIIASFTDYSATNASWNSILYGSTFLALSMVIFFKKMRIRS